MKETDFKINEPAKQLKGGVHRKSTMVNLEKYGSISRRIELNQLLMQTCPEEFEDLIKGIKATDHQILRVISQETIITRNSPTARRKAIKLLGYFPTLENINFLTQLIEFGDDYYIRGEALTALSRANINLGLPIIIDFLSSEYPFEVNRAISALVEYGKINGEESILLLLKNERKATTKKYLNLVLERILNPEKLRKKEESKEDDDSINIMLGLGSKGFTDY